MGDPNEILDQPVIQKSTYDCWRGAWYFGYAISPFLLMCIVHYALKQFISNEAGLPLELWMLAIMVFVALNIAGTILSLDDLLTGIDKREKLAGLISLLINVIPPALLIYLIIDALINFESNL